jgi:lipopolysaccharide transport protein LptA
VRWTGALLIGAALLASGEAPPSKAPPQKTSTLNSDQHPVDMTSRGGLKVDLKKQIGVAKGDVLIRREDVLVCCDEAEAHYNGDQIERVECRGRVVIVRKDGTKARADVAVFEADKDVVTLKGAARVRSPEADLAGEVIVYDIGQDKLDVAGKNSRFRFKPGTSAPLELERPCPPPR